MLIGMITPYAAPVASKEVKDNLEKLGWLLCDGRAVDRNIYSGLFDVIGNSWGDGDSVSTFNLPDLRGYFVRGVDHGAQHDPDASTRHSLPSGGNSGDRVGSYQDDAFREHAHPYFQFVGENDDWKGGGDNGGGYTGSNQAAITGTNGSSETRPKNVYVEFLICWKLV